MREKAQAALFYIQERLKFKPEIGIILGTGLSKLVNVVDVEKIFQYSDIPNFPISTVEFHKGRLIFGRLKNRKIVLMQGRFHTYEGYRAREVSFPILVMKLMGVKFLIISNAAGGLNPAFTPGDIMLISDHINLMADNPLVGQNNGKFKNKFVDMFNCYEPKLIKLAEEVAQRRQIPIKRGVYVAVSGPTLETRAEYRFLRMIGADAVGMSTVPEVIMARYLKIKVLGLSVITDMGVADALKPVSLIKIFRAAIKAEPLLVKTVQGVIERL